MLKYCFERGPSDRSSNLITETRPPLWSSIRYCLLLSERESLDIIINEAVASGMGSHGYSHVSPLDLILLSAHRYPLPTVLREPKLAITVGRG